MNGWKSKELEEKEKKQQLQENAENVEAHASLELKYAQMVNKRKALLFVAQTLFIVVTFSIITKLAAL